MTENNNLGKKWHTMVKLFDAFFGLDPDPQKIQVKCGAGVAPCYQSQLDTQDPGWCSGAAHS